MPAWVADHLSLDWESTDTTDFHAKVCDDPTGFGCWPFDRCLECQDNHNRVVAENRAMDPRELNRLRNELNGGS